MQRRRGGEIRARALRVESADVTIRAVLGGGRRTDRPGDSVGRDLKIAAHVLGLVSHGICTETGSGDETLLGSFKDVDKGLRRRFH